MLNFHLNRNAVQAGKTIIGVFRRGPCTESGDNINGTIHCIGGYMPDTLLQDQTTAALDANRDEILGLECVLVRLAVGLEICQFGLTHNDNHVTIGRNPEFFRFEMTLEAHNTVIASALDFDHTKGEVCQLAGGNITIPDIGAYIVTGLFLASD